MVNICVAFACTRSNLAFYPFKVHFLYRSFAHLFIGQYHLYNTAHHIKTFYVTMCKSPRAYAIIHHASVPFRTVVSSGLQTCVAVHILASSLRPASLLGYPHSFPSHFSCICFFFTITLLLLVFFVSLVVARSARCWSRNVFIQSITGCLNTDFIV